MRPVRHSNNKKRNNIVLFSSVIGAIIIFIAAIIIYLYTYVNNWNNKIYPGVKVAHIDLSGKTKDEAKKIIQEGYVDKVLGKHIVINAKEKDYSVWYKEIGTDYDVDEIVNKAFQHGKEKNLFKKYKMIKNKEKNVLDINFSYDIEKVQPIIEAIKNDVNKNPVNPKLKREGGEFIVIPGEKGYSLREEELKKIISSSLSSDIRNSEIVIEAPIDTLEPKATKEDLEKVDTKISTFTTTFGSNKARTKNIKLSTDSINGLVLLPGDEFDFNKVVGERTAERGYETAHVIVGDKFVDGLGGGICQTSSTLYCAMLRANIDASVRDSHTIASSYVDIGQDATVSWGGPEYKFINTLKYPIYIEGYLGGNSLTFNVYSNSALGKYKYKVYSGDKKVLPATRTVIEDKNLEEGKTQVVKEAYDGHSATVYRETYENGVFVKKQKLYDAKIAPVNGTIKKGTKKVVTVEKEPTEEE
ncbi:Vancomycin resistance protein YoaR, contains peptidoglycan-binding and VanW domains [Hathewaya proteolytica DSM 3090]|uniref:Vancomycin resistance protein YoaR, contains peptidoglycan-binding and VanW domains n=1 Tax=Hathewaya proteolytica DSM 3090 TaxID=1121331 RepID=A0A1M6NS95_9CLOT|nr:VanW family protein [Hathewaya proteolytica]SHJ98534.1 Vancomycin resistance protein YoaR, contains peptidoglycan-binding and VanW domains [Hathewaya proteolytica DSM 3090]